MKWYCCKKTRNGNFCSECGKRSWQIDEKNADKSARLAFLLSRMAGFIKQISSWEGIVEYWEETVENPSDEWKEDAEKGMFGKLGLDHYLKYKKNHAIGSLNNRIKTLNRYNNEAIELSSELGVKIESI